MISKRLTTVISMALVMALTIGLIAYSPATGAVSANVKSELLDESVSKLSPELESSVNDPGQDPNALVRVIVQTRNGFKKAPDSIIANHGRLKRSLPLVGGSRPRQTPSVKENGMS